MVIQKMMTSFALLTLFMAMPLKTEGFSPFEGPTPVGVYIQTNPWAKRIGLDNPRFVLYENRMVIFLKQDSEGEMLYSTLLDRSAFDELRSRLELVANVSGLKGYYDMAPHITDQPKSLFYFKIESGYVTSRVYGMRMPANKVPSGAESFGLMQPRVPPAELLNLHQFLEQFDVPGASEWEPVYIEVLIWPYEYAPEASIHWPNDWPGLNSEMAFPYGDSYSIFLEREKLPALQEFLATQKERGAVEIENKKWAAWWRPVFPSEPIWRGALTAKGQPQGNSKRDSDLQ